VQSVVRQALTDSRFICVCVGEDYRDSHWVQAEYNAGLELEKTFGVARIVVVELCRQAPVPKALIGKPRFSAHHDLAFLSTFLLLANSRTDINPTAPGLPAGVVDFLREDARRLRSLGHRHTAVHIYPQEQFKLAHERFKRALQDQPGNREVIAARWHELTGPKGAMNSWGVGDSVRQLRYRDSTFWGPLAVAAKSSLDRCLAAYECLASHPDTCRLLVTEMQHDPKRLCGELFDPLAELLRSPEHRESAATIHARLSSAVSDLLDTEFATVLQSYAHDMIACPQDLEARERYDTQYAAWHKRWLERSGSPDSASHRGQRRWWRPW
jgi:hypothetical protein